MPRPLRLLFPAAALVLAAGLLLPQTFLSPAPANAQGSPPPFPYVLRGTITLDGAPLAGSAMLTAQVGDWTSRPVEVIDGRFGVAPSQPLVVGPPNLDYIGETVTFHLRGLTADLSFTFEALPQPAFQYTELRFVSGAPPATPTPTAAPTPTAPPAATPTPAPTASPTATPTPTPAPAGGAGAGMIAGAAIGAVLALALALWLLARRLGR